MKKSSKRFVISTESKNDKGFHVRTSGIELLHYEKNPVMLWMHQRPKGASENEILPLGYFEDLAIEDGKLMGTPVFDDTDAFAMKIYNKVENGTIKMASAGIVPVKWDKKGDETWLEKGVLKEISLVDIGSNAEAIAIALYDETDTLISLSLAQIHEKLKTKIDMKLIKLNADELLVKLNLSADATDAEAQTAIENLITLSATQKTTIDTLKSEKKIVEDEKTAIQTKLDEQINLANEAKIIALVDAGFEAKKYTAEQKESLVKLARKDYEGTEELIKGMPSSPDVMGQIDKPATEDKFQTLSWGELHKKGLLIQLKAENFELFKSKFKAEFDKDYQE